MTAGTFQGLPGRWAVKDGGNLPGTCLRLQMNSEGERCGSKETEHERHAPSSSKEPGSLQPFLPLRLHAPSRKENSPGSRSLHSCSTGAPTDEFLALGRFIQGWCVGFFLFERQVEQVGFVLFNTHTMLCLMLDTVQAACCCLSQVRALPVPAPQPPARNTLGAGKFLSHHRETRPGRTWTP